MPMNEKEWHNTFLHSKRSLLKIAQVLKGRTDFLLGAVELEDFTTAQLGVTKGWRGSRTSVAWSHYCCKMPGLVDVEQSFQPGILKRQHGSLSVFSRSFWRPHSRPSDLETVWMKDLWLSKLFGSCVFWEPLLMAILQSLAILVLFQQYWRVVQAGSCLSLGFLAPSVSFVRWRKEKVLGSVQIKWITSWRFYNNGW